MAKELWLPAQEFPVGVTLTPALAVKAITPPLNEITITIVPGADWMLVGGRTIAFTIEQSIDDGVTWRHWIGGSPIPTGWMPRTGTILFGIASNIVVPRKIRAAMEVTGLPVTCGIELDITERVF